MESAAAKDVTGDPVLRLSHVTLDYEGGVRALDDVSLEVARGERLCVLGANGSGKSTLASVLCGLFAPDAGDVELVGRRVLVGGKVDFAAYRLARRSLGLVFQNPDDQIVTSVVAEDVAFGPENLGVPSEQIGERVARELHRVALDDFAQADPTRLSGGQKQRVAIAGALAMEPEALVLDEPGALLDVRGRRSIMRVMARLATAGTTVVHVTHFMEEALEADRVVVMSHGRVALDGTPTEVFSHAGELAELGLEEPFAARLAEALRERGLALPWTCDGEQLAGDVLRLCGRGDRTPQDGGREEPRQVSPASAQVADIGGPAAIELLRVRYSYRDEDARSDARPALDGVSLRVARGSTCAIVGQTGSGKSTLLRIVCGLEAPDAGEVRIGGRAIATRRDRLRLQGGIGYVMQHPERQLFAQTVAEDVAFGPRNLGLRGRALDERVALALELVGLSHKAEASPFELSGGQQRMCAIAGVLAMQPEVLVLDEPTAGLDPRGRRKLRRLLDEVHARGVTVVQVTHSMEDAARCERVVVLDRSHVLASGTPREVFRGANEARLREAGLGLPRALEWARTLESRGVTDLGEPLVLDELADRLVALLPTGGGEA